MPVPLTISWNSFITAFETKVNNLEFPRLFCLDSSWRNDSDFCSWKGIF
ncbi:MAG: hypothetical protein EBT63_02065 [Proteobacteria bacterium]|nr:hypothetical protein [Pseudomonadota bacterium]NCA28802.1 hypothetical protein [Pseudomonadota bacterium]